VDLHVLLVPVLQGKHFTLPISQFPKAMLSLPHAQCINISPKVSENLVRRIEK
jgi:hypothetical protein